MSATWFPGITPSREMPVEIDTSVAHPARVYDYILGGKNNFAADQAAARAALAANPALGTAMRENRAVMRRMTAFLAGEAGVRQFLDIGTGLPTSPNLHEVAQERAPSARVVYVDNDPIVLAHARALLTSSPEGATAYLEADLREPDTILAAARQTLDFSQPIALMLLGILHLVQDAEDPYKIVSHLMDALPAGSYLVISHPASDIHANQAEVQRRYNERVATPQTLRSHAQVCRFFDGLQLIPPGVVYVHTWRADPDDEPPTEMVSAHGGMARKS